MPSIFQMIGKRHLELAKLWSRTAGTYAGVGAVAVVYFTDWRVIVDYIPFYNKKFKED